MSIPALNWAFSLPVEGPAKAVLVALASHADEHTNECWPRIERLILHSGFADRTVRQAIQQLCELGLLVVEGRKFIVSVGAALVKSAPRAARSARPNRQALPPNRQRVPDEPAAPARILAARAVHIENHQEPPKEPSLNQPRQTSMIMPIAGGRPSEATLPAWLPREAWAGFVESRKKMRKPLTDRAKELLLRKLEAFRSRGIDVEAALNEAVINSWQSVVDPTERRGSNRALPRISAAQAARSGHIASMFGAADPPSWHDEAPTIDGDLVRECG